MSHFYNCSDPEPFLTNAQTPPQARKIGAYPSVTTVMGIIKDPFLDGIWSPSKFVELARENPNWGMDEIHRRKFGMRQSPEDNSEMTASEYGTTVHGRLEKHIDSIIRGQEPKLDSDWDAWAEPFLKHIVDNKIEPVSVEFVAWDDELKVAGSVDFIGRLPDGKYYMADYKCRDCKGKGGKFYEKKDCTQLAIESWMLARMWDLEYLPFITSVCIDIGSQKHYHKEWSFKQMQKGIERFKLMSEIYWMDFMNV
tara:strand:- start:1888 stop:2646 length:759 start_codon:yes stop_codon:yes gene_type:complete